MLTQLLVLGLVSSGSSLKFVDKKDESAIKPGEAGYGAGIMGISDAPQWMRQFPNVLGRTENVRVISDNEGVSRAIQFKQGHNWDGVEGGVTCRNEEPASLEELKTNKKFSCPEDGICPCKLDVDNMAMKNMADLLETPTSHVTEHCANRKGYKVAIVGLGTGAVANHVAKHCDVDSIFVIENSQEVYDLAVRYLGFQGNDQPGPIHTIVTDGGSGLQSLLAEHWQSFDAILVDCMVKGKIPRSCKNQDFYQSTFGLLKPGGFAMQWSWREDYGWVRNGLQEALGTEDNQVTVEPFKGSGKSGYIWIEKGNAYS